MSKKEDAIGIRAVYSDAVATRQLKTIFRPNNPKYQTIYKPGTVVDLRIIASPGIAELGIQPVYARQKHKVKIKSLETVALQNLTAADFENSSDDVKDITGLIYQLGLIYNKPAEEFLSSATVIKIVFDYLDTEASHE